MIWYGQNKWSSPGAYYNPSNGKFIIEKNGVAKSNETILKITFKVNENASLKDTTVSLKDIRVSDATQALVISAVSSKIAIKEESGNQGGSTEKPEKPGDNQGGSTEKPGDNQGGNSGKPEKPGDNQGGNSGNQGGNQGNSNNGGSSTGNGTASNQKPVSNNEQTGTTPNKQETPEEIEPEEREEEISNPENEGNNLEKDEKDKEQEDIKLVEPKNGNSSLIFGMTVIAIILVILIIGLIFVLKKQQRR